MKHLFYVVTLFLTLTSLLPAVGKSQGVVFSNKTDYVVSGNPRSMAVADFNGDGKPDIVTTNNYYASVSVLLSNGNGTLGTETAYTVDSIPLSVAVADVNGDGKPDIVTVNNNFDSISVLLNNGNGTFGAKTRYTAGIYPNALAVVDVNGDGKPDIVTANYGVPYGNSSSSTVSVLLNNGNGTFASKTDYAIDYGPYAVAIADVNGDGKPDIISTSSGFVTGSNFKNVINILLNSGNGTFAPKAEYLTQDYPDSVTLGDVNGDGKPDIVTTDPFYTTISVFLNSGNGTFGAQTHYTVGKGPRWAVITDVNGDGKPDIVTANFDNSTVSILIGDGNGTFAPKTDFVVGAGPVVVGVADFNGDGKPDIVSANLTASTISILLNLGVLAYISGQVAFEGIADSASDKVVAFTFRSPGYDDIANTLYVVPSGNFTLNVPKRNGVLHIKGAKYLGVNVNVDTTGGSVSGVTAFLPAGDANNDNKADIADFGILVNAYNSSSTAAGSGYDARTDFNSDGVVDIADFGLLVNNYNRQGDL